MWSAGLGHRLTVLSKMQRQCRKCNANVTAIGFDASAFQPPVQRTTGLTYRLNAQLMKCRFIFNDKLSQNTASCIPGFAKCLVRIVADLQHHDTAAQHSPSTCISMALVQQASGIPGCRIDRGKRGKKPSSIYDCTIANV